MPLFPFVLLCNKFSRVILPLKLKPLRKAVNTLKIDVCISYSINYYDFIPKNI